MQAFDYEVTRSQESQNEGSVVPVETWEVWWTLEWCDLRQQASKINFVRLHLDRQRLSLPKLQWGLFTLHSPFDTRAEKPNGWTSTSAKLHTQGSQF